MRRGRDCFWNANVLDYQISQGSVATQLRWSGSLYSRLIENFPRNLTVKELWKSVSICRRQDQKTKWLFLEHGVHLKQLPCALWKVARCVLFLLCSARLFVCLSAQYLKNYWSKIDVTTNLVVIVINFIKVIRLWHLTLAFNIFVLNLSFVISDNAKNFHFEAVAHESGQAEEVPSGVRGKPP